MQIVSLSGKISLRNIFLSVPQTDTGALAVVCQGKRATMVQGTRQQKLGVTYGRCLPRAWHEKIPCTKSQAPINIKAPNSKFKTLRILDFDYLKFI